ncbi:HERC2 [Symbiodinium sp. KB8]|nr:HERC2 [Symbiodinium sp. KB8]
MQPILRDVQQIQSSDEAFAAILWDGTVVTWGQDAWGGDCSMVQKQLREVREIQDIFRWVVTVMGNLGIAGQRRGLRFRPLAADVQSIASSRGAFAALREDGRVVTWGCPRRGGDSGRVAGLLVEVCQIQSSADAFSAIRGVLGGCAEWWGQQHRPLALFQQRSEQAFAALLADGSVIAWGNEDRGGDAGVQQQLTQVVHIQATRSAFAALREDGSVVAWGSPGDGGDCHSVADRLVAVSEIQAARGAFAALLADGSVVCWGQEDRGGNCAAVQAQLLDVQQIQACSDAFAAIRRDGSVVTWGHPPCGGDSSSVQSQLKDVWSIQSTGTAFVATLRLCSWRLAHRSWTELQASRLDAQCNMACSFWRHDHPEEQPEPDFLNLRTRDMCPSTMRIQRSPPFGVLNAAAKRPRRPKSTKPECWSVTMRRRGLSPRSRGVDLMVLPKPES